MKESHGEGLASHSDPESCAQRREAVGEALTGAHAGEVSSSEITTIGLPTLSPEGEGEMIDDAHRKWPIKTAESKTLGMRGNSMRENRETPPTPWDHQGRSEKARCRTSDAHGGGESDDSIVPTKRPNNAGRPAAEVAEGREATKGNSLRQAALRTQRRQGVSLGLQRVREIARGKRTRFTALLHHVTPALLRSSFQALRREARPGVDGVTWREYEEGLECRLAELHARIQRGTYRAQPSLRTWIPKSDGGQRPLGIAALEDKIVQHAVMVVLEQIYEEEFLRFSYGFRPGRSQHDALDALWVGQTQRKINWVLDADIRGFFDAIDHRWLMKFLEHRLADRRLLRLIGKWLRAGVSEKGQWSPTKTGTPQGAVISPMLANVFLHYVLDLWVRAWRTKEARGDVIIVRYADDVVMGFQHRDEAERFLVALRDRLRQFGLELHPEKTRLIEFGRFAAERRQRRGESKPETFDFLGFTHCCSKTRAGQFSIKRRSIARRMRATLRAVKAKLRRRMHESVDSVGQWLRSVVQGWFNYHAVPSNIRSLRMFRDQVCRYWRHALRRRSQRFRRWHWARLGRLFDRWLPRARILHPYPNERLIVSNPR